MSKATEMPRTASPTLPQLLQRKIYKTGQTRGADDDVIYQNRVSRSSTVLIPYRFWDLCAAPPPGEDNFENSFIALISPDEHFGNSNIERDLNDRGLRLGENAVVFYETRGQWTQNNPDLIGWTPARKRLAPLGGQYVARVPATTASDNSEKIIRGYETTSGKGAGIRLYEYASSATIRKCRTQLEVLYWLCEDSHEVAVENGMKQADAMKRKEKKLRDCEDSALLDLDELHNARIIDREGNTICPLCLERLSGNGFFNRLAQAEGREVPDLTVTQINLFHIEELRLGKYNHRPYNLGWGHHHCNVVVRDSGIAGTLRWMDEVVRHNIRDGHLIAGNNSA